MKKILVIIGLLMLVGFVFGQTRYEEAMATIDPTPITIVSDTLYSTDTGSYALAAAPTEIEYYKAYEAEIKIEYNGNPNNVNLIIGYASSMYELTGANAVLYFMSAKWTTLTIDLNTSGGTSTYYTELTGGTLVGKYIYFYHAFSGDPGNNPTVTVTLNKL